MNVFGKELVELGSDWLKGDVDIALAISQREKEQNARKVEIDKKWQEFKRSIKDGI